MTKWCHVMGCLQEMGMLPLLSCDNDKTAWLKGKYKDSGVSREEEETW